MIKVVPKWIECTKCGWVGRVTVSMPIKFVWCGHPECGAVTTNIRILRNYKSQPINGDGQVINIRGKINRYANYCTSRETKKFANTRREYFVDDFVIELQNKMVIEANIGKTTVILDNCPEHIVERVPVKLSLISKLFGSLNYKYKLYKYHDDFERLGYTIELYPILSTRNNYYRLIISLR